MDDVLIEAILKIANDKNVIQRLEPHIAFPMKVEEWQVKRILEAVRLLKEEYGVFKRSQSHHQHNE